MRQLDKAFGAPESQNTTHYVTISRFETCLISHFKITQSYNNYVLTYQNFTYCNTPGLVVNHGNCTGSNLGKAAPLLPLHRAIKMLKICSNDKNSQKANQRLSNDWALRQIGVLSFKFQRLPEGVRLIRFNYTWNQDLKTKKRRASAAHVTRWPSARIQAAQREI